MRFKNYCIGCRKWKWFAKVRDLYFKPANTMVKSQGALCRHCFRIIKKAN